MAQKIKKSDPHFAFKVLDIATLVFDDLDFKLSFNGEIEKGSDAEILDQCAKNYNSGFGDLQYKACVRMYWVFGVTGPNKFLDLKEKLKIKLRDIANKFYPKKVSRLQLHFD